MPVEIPKINRFETQAPQSAGRLEIQAPNLLGATAPLREGLGNLVEAGVDVVTAQQKEIRKKELETKDLKSTEHIIKYETLNKNDLTKIEQLKGDVTPYYEKFDKDMADRESKLYDEVTDPETQMMLKEKIQKANWRINETRTVQQTKQYYNWQNDVANASVKLRQDNAMKYAESMNVANYNASFTPVYKSLDEIEQTRVRIAEQNGFVVRDENGKIDYSKSPQIQAQISKDMGDVIVPMVKALNAAGKANEAKQVIKDKKQWLNANDLATLTADTDEANVKNQALALISTLKNPSGKSAFAEIESSKHSDAVKFKAREIVDTMDRQNQNALDRKRKDAETYLYNFVDSKQNSDQPFVSISQFKDSPQYKEYKDVLTASDMKALEQRVEAPPVSDPAALKKISEISMTTAFKDLSNESFNKLLKDLNKEDRDKYTTIRRNLIKPPEGMTEAQARARAEAMNHYLMNDAELAGILPKKPIDKYSEKDTEYFIKTFEPAWTSYYGKHGYSEKLNDPNAQRQMVRDFIREFTANPENNPPTVPWYQAGKTREVKELPALEYWQQSPNSPLRDPENITPLGVKNISKPPAKVTKPTTSNVDLDDMVVNNPSQFKALANEYMKETGASSLPEKSVLQAWINKKVKK